MSREAILVVKEEAGIAEDQLAAVLCSGPPSRMSKDAERYTHESWKCNGNFGSVRIDLYADSGQQQAANAAVLSFYRGSGDKRTLAELPLACGTAWGAGFDENSQRDAATAELAAAGLAGGPCDS